MSLKGTKTEENLWAAFAGESQTRNKYTYFAEIARHEGHENIAAVFDILGDQEKDHAKTILSFLNGLKDTATNLRISAENEGYEGTTMYKEFERVAREEGFMEIADFFENVGKIEMEHEKMFLSLLNQLRKDEA
ncbi:rubrerythrin family protein [Natronincola ferrireducens]|uniref:Rubrerythrin n=1 Tax=Natronincola ferrireducens TaxID=393762 RepID=A0A1G8Y765_9FIRM|nr:rubrerythrin family protein [Natronincola ferrireducens]SDJ97910.1 Rubrerythrin [Natronincola ferrireducens]